MKIEIPYGEGFQTAEIDDKYNVEVIDPETKPVETDIKTLIQRALDNPVGTPRLEEIVTKDNKVTIIVNDQTRPGPHAEMASALLERLKMVGVPDENISFMVATGSHVGPNKEQLHKILGGLEERFVVRSHDCRAEDHVYMGRTKTYDVPIYLDKHVAEADFIITTGMIAPHHSAGFSGGRKSIVPGVVSLDTLKIHHSLPIRPYEPAINFLEENPFHLVALEAARMVNVRFILNVVQDLHKQIVDCVAGDMEEAHMAGVAVCRRENKVDVHGLADLVISSPGGHPRDIDLWQSQKALSVAELVCEKGSDNTFILVARAEQGIPQLFIDWMTEAKTPQDVVDRFRREGFEEGTNKAFMYARCMLKGRIIVVTEGLSPELIKQVKMEWAPDLQTAIKMAIEKKEPKKITVLPRSVSMIPHIV